MLWPIDGDDLDGVREWPEDTADYDYTVEYKKPLPLTDRQMLENERRNYLTELRMRKEELDRYYTYLKKAEQEFNSWQYHVNRHEQTISNIEEALKKYEILD